MRRPLFFISFCVVFVVVLFRLLRPDGEEVVPPDQSHIIFSGKIIQKDEDSFVIKIQTDNIFQRNATLLWQENPECQLHTEYKKLQCEYEDASELVLGSLVRLEGEFREYTEAGNPGEFDYAAYYHSLDYAGKLRDVRILAQDGKAPGLREGLYRLRLFWEKRLYQIFPEKEASVMTAMLLGDKSDLDAEIKELYRRNGIIHILSISGLHITLLGMGFYKRLRCLGVPAWAAALAGGTLLFLYGMMTGFGISACRAIGMYLIRMAAQIVGRTYDMLTALGVIATVLVCVHPAWLGHMGFLLSFGSILGLGALLPALETARREAEEVKAEQSPIQLYRAGKWRQKLLECLQAWVKLLKQGFWAGLSVTLTTLPIQLWFSFEIPTYSLLLNILILPFMSIVMAAGLMAMLIPGLGVIGTFDMVILAGYEGLCRLFEKLPYSMWNPGRPQIWQMVSYYLIWMTVVWGLPVLQKYLKRHRRLFPKWRCQLVLMGTALLFLGLPRLPETCMTFLDVGQGDGMCLRLATGEVYLFDCGSSNRKKIGERVLVPFLKYYGIGQVDAVFISHGDADHLNGLLELFEMSEKEHIRIRQVVLPDLEKGLLQEEFSQVLQAIQSMPEPPVVSTVCAGSTWQSKGRTPVSFLCLHPVASRLESKVTGGNACSECFCISFPITAAETTAHVKLLLTGDVEGDGERELIAALQQYQITDIDILKCPHHGSKGTTSAELLTQIMPADTVISCGKNNRYGHPHAELMDRLKTVRSRVCQTPQAGAVTVRITKTGYKLLTYK